MNPDVLLKAADLIEAGGLAFGTFRDGDAFCAIGAIRFAATGSTAPCSSKYNSELQRLALVVDPVYGVLDPWDCITKWNDRSDKETVVNALRKAAQT